MIMFILELDTRALHSGMWPHRPGGRKNKDDISSLAAVYAPVLWPVQAGDAHMTPLQTPHVGAEFERKYLGWIYWGKYLLFFFF